jgi:HSP20 family protein
MEKTLTKQNRGSLRSGWLNPLDRFYRSNFLDFWNDDIPQTIPALNVTEDKNQYKIEMAAPGLKKEDFKIDIDGNLLTVSADTETETKEDKDSNYRREYNYSCFSRSITLPDTADANRISAKYTDGVLNLSIPKKADGQNKNVQQIKVQ